MYWKREPDEPFRQIGVGNGNFVKYGGHVSGHDCFFLCLSKKYMMKKLFFDVMKNLNLCLSHRRWNEKNSKY